MSNKVMMLGNEAIARGAYEAGVKLSSAYPEEAGVIEFNRSLSLCDSEVHINDSFTLRDKEEVEFRFLTTEKPLLREPGKLTRPAGRTLFYAPSLKFEAVKVETESYDPNKLCDTEALWQIRLKTMSKDGKFEFKII